EKKDSQGDSEPMRKKWRAIGAQRILTVSLSHCEFFFQVRADRRWQSDKPDPECGPKGHANHHSVGTLW
ncbi:MAG TPA: hypothetical protein VG274_07655, partial [Rhizomicrobium sp.]|nr:hypothetical protein [Rhizomicrobium sp.]